MLIPRYYLLKNVTHGQTVSNSEQPTPTDSSGPLNWPAIPCDSQTPFWNVWAAELQPRPLIRTDWSSGIHNEGRVFRCASFTNKFDELSSLDNNRPHTGILGRGPDRGPRREPFAWGIPPAPSLGTGESWGTVRSSSCIAATLSMRAMISVRLPVNRVPHGGGGGRRT